MPALPTPVSWAVASAEPPPKTAQPPEQVQVFEPRVQALTRRAVKALKPPFKKRQLVMEV